jgi:hypothetical protein
VPSWYDAIPVVGSAIEAGKGNWKQAGIDMLGPGAVAIQGGYDALHGANQEQKNGYLTAAAQARQLADQQKAFQMQGLGQAESYYGGARARLNKMYGDPNAVPPSTGPATETASGRGHF